MRNAVILSTGAYVPERVIPNSYFNSLLGEDVDSWLRNNLQIYERRWCAANESTADICVHAAEVAMDKPFESMISCGILVTGFLIYYFVER